MSRKHSTLLKEEVDDEENSSGSDGVVKKREKDKDGEYKKKKVYKKGDKNEGYYNDSMTKSAKPKTVAIGGAAVNPTAETITSPVHSQQSGVIPAPLQPPPSARQQNQQTFTPVTAGNMQAYTVTVGAMQVPVHAVSAGGPNWQQQQQQQQQAMMQRLPPPPGTQHAQIAQQYQQVQSTAPIPQAQYASQNAPAPQRQVYQAQAPQQQGQNYQPPPPQQGQVYQPPQQQGQNYQPPPPQQPGQVYQAQPPQQQGQNFQPPPPQQQGQNFQPPPPQQQGQNFQPPPPQQQGQNFQPPPTQQQGQNFQPPASQQQGQNFQTPSSQQGYYAVAVVQYPNQVAGQVAGYPGGVHGQAIPHPPAPQSPTGQGQVQVHDPNWQQYADGNWTGHPSDGTWTGPPIPPDQQRDGNWAAFDGNKKTPQKPNRKEITWRESPDNSSSGEEIESHDDDDDDEEQQELIRPPSPSKSTSSAEEEHEASPWQIQPDQYEYYTKQFKRLEPNEGGVIKGPKARDFFLKSNLSTEILSKVWHLSDINQDNALDLDEFCIAMHLVVAIRHGLDLPAVLPHELLHHRQVYNDLQAGKDSEDITEMKEEESKPVIKYRRNRSQSDTSLNEDHHPEIVSRKISMPTTKIDDDGRPLSPDENVKIPRPKATNISLIDTRPGQLLPPPQPGKFPSWTPSKTDQDSDSAESDDEDDSEKSSDEEEETQPMSQGHTVPAPIPMPPLSEDETKDEEGAITPPSTPKGEIPEPVFPDIQQVTRRLSKKSIDRPRSAGDVNEIAPQPSSDGSAGSTPTNSSIGSDGKKDPPPPPPRRKEKGHSRSSSLDLNKLFGPKSKETRANTFGSPTSSQSSQTSQSGEVPLPLKTEPEQEQEESDSKQTTDNAEETSEKPTEEEENFADFSNFETLVKAQGTASDSHMDVPSQGRTHRRSLSLDHAQNYWPKESAVNGPSKTQEALPRPVPKLKPPVSPPVKLLTLNKQTPRKEGTEERKLKTEPPKVVVKPLTKESKLQNNIRELKETNLLLSRLNSDLQQENKETMEQRISLELKLERLKPFKSK